MTHTKRIYIIASADSNLSQEQLAIKKSMVGAIEREGFAPQEFFGSGGTGAVPGVDHARILACLGLSHGTIMPR
jgi:hypothetical protein